MSVLKGNGVDPVYSNDQIIASELKKLGEFRHSIKDENGKYVEDHPEFRTIMDDFVTAVLNHKPTDIVKFGSYFFTHLQKHGEFGPCPIVICGPSGVGKGTIITKLMATFPAVFGFSVSHTTRAPRPGEVDGVHYNFISKPEFEDAVERGEFIEYAKVHTNYYGTTFHGVEKIRQQNKICILDIDIQGVQNVKKSKLDCRTVFISPPSMTELETRLKGRATETADKIKIRLDNAIAEMNYGQQQGNFDKIVVNDNLEHAFERLLHEFQQWFPELDLYLRK